MSEPLTVTVPFSKKIKLLLACYNAGMKNVIDSGYEVPNFPETQAYIDRIEREYGKAKPVHEPRYADTEWLEIQCREYRLDYQLMFGVITAESDWNPSCITPNHVGGAIGLFQIVSDVWFDMTHDSLNSYFDNAQVSYKNITVGCKYFRWLLDNFIEKWEQKGLIK